MVPKASLQCEPVTLPTGIVERLGVGCATLGLTTSGLSDALAHPGVRYLLLGGRTVAKLRDNLASLGVRIPPEFWSYLRAEGLVDANAPLPVDHR